MTALGQKCPKQLRLPAGKNTHERMGRIMPDSDIRLLFDHLVGADEDRLRHGEP
jgi:hypothetical protein